MTKEQLEPLAEIGWKKGCVRDNRTTFDQYLNRIVLWAIENPSAAEELVRQINRGEWI